MTGSVARWIPRGMMAMAALGAVLSLSTRARAFPTANLVYVRGTGAEHCPEEMALRMAVAARLGYDPFDRDAKKRIVATIETEKTDQGERLVGRVDLVNDDALSEGERRHTAGLEECGELTSAMALSISIAIDPERAAQALSEATTNDERESADGSPTAAAAEPAEPERDHEGSLRSESVERGARAGRLRTQGRWMVPAIGLGAHVSAFAVPGVGGGADLALVGRFERASMGVEGRFDSSLSGRAIDAGEVRGSLWVVSLVPCWEPGVPFVCAIASAGRFRGSSAGVSDPRTDMGTLIAAGARAGAMVGLGQRFELRAHVDLLGTLTPLELELDGRKVWQTEAASAVLGLSLFAVFP